MKYITAAEAAKHLGITTFTLTQNYLRTGRIPGAFKRPIEGQPREVWAVPENFEILPPNGVYGGLHAKRKR